MQQKITILVSATLATIILGCGSTGAGSSADSATGSSTDAGVGGSQARFVISSDYLYTLNETELTAFDISQPSDPLPYTQDYVPFDVKTLFSYGDHLYIGSQSGVYIYTKPSPSSTMEQVATFSHLTACDPVVVENDLAFVTLNTGRSCWVTDGANALEILDVKDPLTPKLIYTEQLIEPTGLGVDNGNLFVCDGIGGLKVFHYDKVDHNETNETRVTLTFDRNSSVSDVDCYDVIPYNNNLVVSNGEDVRQYDYSQFPMVELGRIK